MSRMENEPAQYTPRAAEDRADAALIDRGGAGGSAKRKRCKVDLTDATLVVGPGSGAELRALQAMAAAIDGELAGQEVRVRDGDAVKRGWLRGVTVVRATGAVATNVVFEGAGPEMATVDVERVVLLNPPGLATTQPSGRGQVEQVHEGDG